MLPAPTEAWFNWPGFAFASAIRSATLRAGKVFCTISAGETWLTMVTGAKSRTVSKGIFA